MDALSIAALVVAAVALLIALSARSKAAGIAQAAEDAKAEARRAAARAVEEVEPRIQNLRQLLCLVRSGAPLTDEMIMNGQLYADLSPEDGKRLVQQGGIRILDVRTPQETAMGVIPGALLIPIDQIEGRMKELPKDGQPTLVYCAGGGRSAAACELLSSQGYTNLRNLTGGIGAYSGPVERK